MQSGIGLERINEDNFGVSAQVKLAYLATCRVIIKRVGADEAAHTAPQQANAREN